MQETKFAFIVHPVDRRHYTHTVHHLEQARLKSRPGLSTHHVAEFSESINIITFPFSFNKLTATCDVILCPLLPKEMVSNQTEAVSKIIKLVNLAQRRNARLVGLGGFTSIIGNGGIDIARDSALPVTSGNVYTSASVVQAIINASELHRVNLRESCLAIIGATGDIGSACSKALASAFGEMILVARNDQRLNELAQSLKSICSHVSIEKHASKAAANADVVVTVTSSTTTLLQAIDIKKNSIVCDVSYPANLAKEVGQLRPDLFVFEGGIVASKHFVSQADDDLFWDFNPKGGMHACFVETLLLALEKKLYSYSIGRGSITHEKMREMAKLGEKYGFNPFFSWDGKEIITSNV